MSLLLFAVEVIAISASGVLAPGPLFFANLLYGSRQGTRSGIKVAYGHTIVELPLIIILAVGLFTSSALSKYASAIGLVGGLGILVFALLQIGVIVLKRNPVSSPTIASSRGPFVAGVALSALNPFFLIWWFTIGLKLIADSAAFGVAAGIMILFGLHVWLDYAWLTGTAYLASKGGHVLKSRYYQLLLLAVSAALLYYGISFVYQSLYANFNS